MNLGTETRHVLEEHGKAVSDVKWAVIDGLYKLNPATFFNVADTIFYDEGFGGNEINLRLVIIGDGWRLERREYDGSEWWQYKEDIDPDKLVEQTDNVLMKMAISDREYCYAMGGQMWPDCY